MDVENLLADTLILLIELPNFHGTFQFHYHHVQYNVDRILDMLENAEKDGIFLNLNLYPF